MIITVNLFDILTLFFIAFWIGLIFWGLGNDYNYT